MHPNVVHPAEILAVLDNGARDFVLPMLDNGYYYLAASRLSLFRSPADWALVFEIFSFSPRAGVPDLCITTFASRVANRKDRADFVSEDAYLNYLRVHAHDDMAFFHPIEDDGWIDPDDGEHVASGARELLLRGEPVPVPDQADYTAAGIILKDPQRPFVFELCRALACTRREAVLATTAERSANVSKDLQLILALDDWHHPNVVEAECLPSTTATFRQFAQVLASGDRSDYVPSEPPNTHWSNWPDGGLL